MKRIYAVLLILPLILGAGPSAPPVVSETPFRADGSVTISKDKSGKEQYQVNLYAGQKFYRDSTGKWREPDLTVASVGGVSKVNGGFYQAGWHADRPADYTIRAGQDSIVYTADFLLDSIIVQRRGTRYGVKMDVILRHKKAATLLKWHVRATRPLDANLRNGVFQIQPFTATDADGKTVALAYWLSSDTLYCELMPKSGNRYPITVDPTTVTTTQTSSALLSKASATWAGTRDATTATYVYQTAYRWGVQNYLSGTEYTINRQFLCFDLSGIAAGYTCDSCKLWFYRSGNDYLADTLFTEIDISTQTGAAATSWYNDFVGWAASGQYTTKAPLSNHAKITDVYAPLNTWFNIPLNAVGCDTLENRFGGSDSLRVVILNRNDFNNSAPPTSINNNMQCIVDSVAYLQVFASAAGWTGWINGVTDPAEFKKVPVANIQDINGVP